LKVLDPDLGKIQCLASLLLVTSSRRAEQQ
jgi:hypothetical protein